VVITGSLGAVWPIALSGLADEPGVGTTALVTGISTPSAEDLRTCSRYPQFVVGRLGPALCDQFSVAAGVQVTAARTEGLGDLGALRIAVHDRCLVIERLVLWPGDNSGEIR
jgi:hypothetical protein